MNAGRVRTAGAAVGSGALIAFSVPPWGWWPLAFLGVAGLSRLIGDRAGRGRAFMAALTAVGWFLPSLIWMADFTPPGYVITIVIFGAMLVLAAVVTPPGPARWIALPGALVLMELTRWSWPFGGVPLSTLAMSQADAPLAPSVRFLGPLLLVFLVGLLGVTLDAAASAFLRRPVGDGPSAIGGRGPAVSGATELESGPDGRDPDVAADATTGTADGDDGASREATDGRRGSEGRHVTLRRAAGLGGAFALLAVFSPLAPHGDPVGSVDVALVQGGGPQRTRAADTNEREVFERHLAASELVDGPVDLVVWPENVINVEGAVTANPEGEELSELARSLDAPLVVGAVEGEDHGFRNSALLVDRDGEFTGRYEKVRRVPFGEYVPLRGLLEPFAGEALPPRDAIAGDGPAVLDSSAGPLGVVISWEVFFAPRARDAIGVSDGEILLNPTNGSSYWLTIVQSQQVASSRLRALETGRWVLQTAPTGFSAVVDPDGDVLQRTAVSERAVLQATVDRRTGQTIATRVGDWPMFLIALAVIGAGWAVGRRTA